MKIILLITCLVAVLNAASGEWFNPTKGVNDRVYCFEEVESGDDDDSNFWVGSLCPDADIESNQVAKAERHVGKAESFSAAGDYGQAAASYIAAGIAYEEASDAAYRQGQQWDTIPHVTSAAEAHGLAEAAFVAEAERRSGNGAEALLNEEWVDAEEEFKLAGDAYFAAAGVAIELGKSAGFYLNAGRAYEQAFQAQVGASGSVEKRYVTSSAEAYGNAEAAFEADAEDHVGEAAIFFADGDYGQAARTYLAAGMSYEGAIAAGGDQVIQSTETYGLAAAAFVEDAEDHVKDAEKSNAVEEYGKAVASYLAAGIAYEGAIAAGGDYVTKSAEAYGLAEAAFEAIANIRDLADYEEEFKLAGDAYLAAGGVTIEQGKSADFYGKAARAYEEATGAAYGQGKGDSMYTDEYADAQAKAEAANAMGDQRL